MSSRPRAGGQAWRVPPAATTGAAPPLPLRLSCQPLTPRTRLALLCLCTGDCGIGLSVWIIVAGAIQLPLSQLPDMGSMDALTALAVVFCALYCVVAVVLSIVDGERRRSACTPVHGSCCQ